MQRTQWMGGVLFLSVVVACQASTPAQTSDDQTDGFPSTEDNSSDEASSEKGRVRASLGRLQGTVVEDGKNGPSGDAPKSRERLRTLTVPSASEVEALVTQVGGGGIVLSLAHLAAGRPASDLEVYRFGLTKALNSVSLNPKIVALTPLDSAESVYRFQPADFTLKANDLDAIFGAPGAKEAVKTVGASRIVQGDWLVYALTRPEIYDRILRIPNDVLTLESQLGVNRSKGDLRATIPEGKSSVTFGLRTLERIPIDIGGEPGGYYWRSIDYFAAIYAGEFFFSLPNGLQAYMLSGFVYQHRIDAQPFVATDFNRPQDGLFECVGGAKGCGYVINGESCITCHSGGMKPSAHITNVQGGSPADFENALAKDAARFARAIAKMGFNVGANVEPVLETLKAYRAHSGNADKRFGGPEVYPVLPAGTVLDRR